ncbi:hypothetical protein [Sodalis sp. C49]|uniref:hypothetical protein n=1 Tax=unclassified Sodalis (in: enterobacteria) TaxID=2636512 RepID=UPI00396594A1
MKYIVVNILLFLACLLASGLLWAVSPVPAPAQRPASGDFSPQQQAEIEHIVENYLVAHPDILAKMNPPPVSPGGCRPVR